MMFQKTLVAFGFVAAVMCSDHACTAEDPHAEFKAMLPSGSADVDITVEEAVVGRFAGFFNVEIRSLSHESGGVPAALPDHGMLALTLDRFDSQPAGRPTGLSGLAAVGNQTIPSKIRLKVRPRANDDRSFNVTLRGLTESQLVGVATVSSDSITLRLQGDNPHTTVVVLKPQPRTPQRKPVFGEAVQSDAGLTGVIGVESRRPYP